MADPNPILDTAEKAKAYLTEQMAASGITETAKGAYKAISDNVDEMYRKGKPLVVKEGKLDLTGLREWAGRELPSAQGALDAAGKALKDTSRAIYDVGAAALDGAGQAAEGIGGFLDKNKFGLMGGIMAAVVAMSAGEMGIIGALLMGLLAFAVIGGMADQGGMVKSMLGGNRGADGQARTPSLTPPGLSAAPPAPEKGKFQFKTREGLVATGVDKDGKIVYGSANTAEGIAIPEVNPAKELVGGFIVKETADKTGVVVLGSYGIMKDGKTPGPVAMLPAAEQITLPIDGEGKIDLSVDLLNPIRQKAAEKAAAYQTRVEKKIEAASTVPGSPDIQVKYDEIEIVPPGSPAGTTTKEKYTVLVKGKRTTNAGGQDVFKADSSVLVDASGTVVTGADGKPLPYKFNEPVDYAIEKDAANQEVVKFMSGRIPEFTTAMTNNIDKQKKAQIAAIEISRKAEQDGFVGAVADMKAGTLGAALEDKWREKLLKETGAVADSVEESQVKTAADAIAAKYNDPSFLTKPSADVAAEIQDIIKTNDLKKGSVALDITESAKSIHEGVTREVLRKEAVKDGRVTNAEFDKILNSSRTDNEKAALASMQPANGYIVRTPEAKDGDLGSVIYAKSDDLGNLTDIQVALKDGTLMRVNPTYKDENGVERKYKDVDGVAILVAARDASQATVIDKNATLVDDIAVPLTRSDRAAGRTV